MPTILHKLSLGSLLIALATLAPAQAADSTGTAPSSASGASDTAGTATTTIVPNPANSAATDPYVQRREATSKAKEEYNAKKKAAKEEYKATQKAIDVDAKASSGTSTGEQFGAKGSGSSASGK